MSTSLVLGTKSEICKQDLWYNEGVPFEKGHKHNENWYRAVSRPRPQNVRDAVSRSQRGRRHTEQEGFQKGHPSFEGTQGTRFSKGQIPWNKGNSNPDFVKRKLRTYRANAKKAGRVFDIELEFLRELLRKPCYYCGGKSTGMDREDNSMGYIKSNVLPCCEVCNHMKWKLTKKEFIDRCSKIITTVGYEI